MSHLTLYGMGTDLNTDIGILSSSPQPVGTGLLHGLLLSSFTFSSPVSAVCYVVLPRALPLQLKSNQGGYRSFSIFDIFLHNCLHLVTLCCCTCHHRDQRAIEEQLRRRVIILLLCGEDDSPPCPAILLLSGGESFSSYFTRRTLILLFLLC